MKSRHNPSSPAAGTVPRWLLWLGLSLLAGCDGSGSSSPRQEPEPPAEPSDLLVYTQDSTSRLYKLDTSGRSTPLSEGTLPAGFVISPDGGHIAYADSIVDGQTAIAIRNLTDNAVEPPEFQYPGEVYPAIQWEPDSAGVVYTVFDTEAFISHLYLATLGEPDPLELIGSNLGAGARLQVELSADGSRLAVLAQYFASSEAYLPDSAALYLLVPSNGTAPELIGTAEGDANSFRFAWSPYANELVYQRRLLTEPSAPSIPDNYPAGPLMLMEASGTSRVLREADGETDWTYLDWLDPTRLLAGAGGFGVIDTDGSLVTSHSTTGNGQIVVSPDKKRLAFLDSNGTDGRPAVNMLELDSGEYRVLGPASSVFLTGRAFEDSALHWSPDGSRLAWNLEPGPFNPDREDLTGELYVHDVGTARTQLVTAELAQHERHRPDKFFAWLPVGVALDYVTRTAVGYELVLLDTPDGPVRKVGELASVACGVERAWQDSAKVFWNQCGQGVYISARKQDGTFAATRVAEWDVWRMVTTANRAFTVMQPTHSGSYSWDAAWQVYGYDGRDLQELEGTAGTLCCGTLLQ